MQLRYLGHSCFLLTTPKARIVIDPFLTGNPSCPAGVTPASLACDAILVSHGHEDHSGDALALSLAHGAPIIANYELAEYFAAKGAKAHGMNPGGAHGFPFGRVKLTLAHHSSSVEAGLAPIYLGNPCGILLEVDGRTLYHAGDTALFLDMQLIGKGRAIDVAMLPIGDNFTMGPEDAVEALEMLRPRLAVPMHYNTWPVIAQDPEHFRALAAGKGHEVCVMKPGATLEL